MRGLEPAGKVRLGKKGFLTFLITAANADVKNMTWLCFVTVMVQVLVQLKMIQHLFRISYYNSSS